MANYSQSCYRGWDFFNVFLFSGGVKMKFKGKLILISALLIIVMSNGIIQASNYPVQITDDLGRKVVIERKPERVISLAPSYTETIFTLGADDRLVGVTKYADYPEAATKIEKIGSIKEPSLEQIIQLRPDLVLAAGITPKNIIDRLGELGIKVIGLSPQNIYEIVDTISVIGKATGQGIEANKLTTQMRSKIESITDVIDKNVKESTRPKVFYEVWKKPLYTAGPSTYIDNLINVAGGINIAHNSRGKWTQYNFEVLLAENPDIYIASEHSWENMVSKESIMKREKFQDIKAIKEGKVYILNPNIVNRAGPRIVIALEQIAKAIHPGLFK
jgi:iron complex transport system substrate-binding protein